jgi:autotransporter-associated beta strand protein
MNTSPKSLHPSAARLLAAILFAGLMLAGERSAQAVTGFFTNNITGSATYAWTNPAAWLNATIANGPGDIAHFDYDITTSRSILLYGGGPKTVGSLFVGDTVSSYFAFTYNGQSIYNSATPMSANPLIFDNAHAGNATLYFNQAQPAATGNNTFNCYFTLKDNLTIEADMTSATSYQYLYNNISESGGSYSLTKTGVGQIILGGYNTYSGGTTISAGRVLAGSLSPSAGTSSSGVFGSGSVSVASGAQAYLSGNSSYANNFSIAGNGVIEGANTLGALKLGLTKITGGITLTGAARIGVTNGSYAFLNGSLTGSTALEINSTQTGASGTLYLNGDGSAYTGNLTNSQGRLNLAGNLGGNLTVADAASLGYRGTTIAGNLTLGGTTGAFLYSDITNSSALAVTGNLTLNGVNTNNVLRLPAASPVTLMTYGGALTGSAANLTLPGAAATYRPGTSFTVGGGSVQLNFVQGSETWTGGASGTWDFAAANWSGTSATFFNFDTVNFTDAGANKTIAIASPVTIGDMTVNNSVGNNYTFSGVLTGGSLTKSGAGLLNLLGTNNFTGPIAINGGAVGITNIAGAGSFALGERGGNINLNGGKLLLYGGDASTVTLYKNLTVTGAGNGYTNTTPASLVLVGDISGSGNLTLDLTNNSSFFQVGSMAGFSGTLIVNTWSNGVVGAGSSGGLQLALNDDTVNTSGSALAKFQLNGGGLGGSSIGHALMMNNRTGTCFMGELSGTGGANVYAKTARNGDVTLETGALNTSSTFDGNLKDSFSTGGASAASGFGAMHLKKVGSGTLTLSGVNGYTGNTTVSGGTLKVGASGRIGSVGAATYNPIIDVQSGATWDVSSVAGGVAVLRQNLIGKGSITGQLTNNWVFSPGEFTGDIGTLTFSGGPILNSNLVMELNRTNAQTADKLVISSGALNYGGTLTVSNVGPALQAGDSFMLFSAASYTGGFASNSLPTLGAGLFWNTNNLSVDGTISVATAPTVTVSPASTNIVYGNSATLTANTTGTAPLSYQWYDKNTNVISGATGTTLTLTNPAVAASGNYTVIVTNLFGRATNFAAVTVTPAGLSITANNDSKTYGQTKIYGAGQTAFTSMGLQNGETIGSVTITASGGVNPTAAVGPYSLIPSAPVGGTFNPANYAPTYNNGTLTVNPLAVVLSGTRPYDGTTDAAAAILSVANKVGVDDVTVSSGVGGLAGASVGTQTITAFGTLALGGTTAGNYMLIGASGSVVITAAATAISLSSSAPTSGYGDSVFFTATTLPTNVTGTVTFATNGAALNTSNLVSGAASSLAIANLPRGTNLVTAIYSGDANYLPATNTLNQVVTNHPPVASNATYYRAIGETLLIPLTNLLAHVTDADGDVSTLQSLGASAVSAVITNDSNFVYYQPAPGTNSADSFTYTVSDGFGGSATATVFMNVYPAAGPAQINSYSNGVANIQFYGAPNHTYVVQTTTNLLTPWWTISTNVADTNGTWNFTDPNATNAAQFYRPAQP